MLKRHAVDTVVIRSGGDIATGVVQKFSRAGFRVAVLELAAPFTIRRTAALSSAVRQGLWTVEDITAQLAASTRQCRSIWGEGRIPVLVDPEMKSLETLRPAILVDAIIAKRNTGVHPGLAPITIALGPGFKAPDDVDCVIETMRGHNLGRLVTCGEAMPNTGVPGDLGGKSRERVVYAPADGIVKHARRLGDRVEKGEVLFTVGGLPVKSHISGMLRGLIAEETVARKGLKCADVDPRRDGQTDCTGISDKARALGGAALEAGLMLAIRKRIALRLAGLNSGVFHFENFPNMANVE